MSYDSRPARSFACWLEFLVLTSLSLWCAYGTTATKLAEKFATKTVAMTKLESSETRLDRLRRQRDALSFEWSSAEAVAAAEAAVAMAVEHVKAERARGGCGELCRDREAEERAAREIPRRAQESRAATVKAEELDAAITRAEAALANVDLKQALERPIHNRPAWPRPSMWIRT